MEDIYQLSAIKLDILVAEAIGLEVFFAEDQYRLNYIPKQGMASREWAPSRFWSQGGPLIEKYKIDLNWDWQADKEWTASIEPDINVQGLSVLEAAMRALVCVKLSTIVHCPL